MYLEVDTTHFYRLALHNLFKSKLFKWWMSHGDMTDYGHITIIGVLFNSLNPSKYRAQLLFKLFIRIDFHVNCSFLNAIF